MSDFQSKPLVELFVKESPTMKFGKSAHLISQQWFMTLYCLVEQGLITMRCVPTSLERPDNRYSQLNAARHIPIARVTWSSVNKNDSPKIEDISSTEDLEMLMKKVGSPNLNIKIPLSEVCSAEEVFNDLYKKFIGYLLHGHWTPLSITLTKLDQFLAEKGQMFLLNKRLTYADCQLMPKLQHIRVALRYYKKIDVPENLTHLWAYIKHMYEADAFRHSCPLDRDILFTYSEKNALLESNRLSLLEPDCLSEVPLIVGNSEQMIHENHN